MLNLNDLIEVTGFLKGAGGTFQNVVVNFYHHSWNKPFQGSGPFLCHLHHLNKVIMKSIKIVIVIKINNNSLCARTIHSLRHNYHVSTWSFYPLVEIIHCYPVPTKGLGWDLRNDCWMYYLRISYLHFILPSFSRPFTAIFMAEDQKKWVTRRSILTGWDFFKCLFS